MSSALKVKNKINSLKRDKIRLDKLTIAIIINNRNKYLNFQLVLFHLIEFPNNIVSDTIRDVFINDKFTFTNVFVESKDVAPWNILQ